jgi:methylglyoxal synthase
MLSGPIEDFQIAARVAEANQMVLFFKDPLSHVMK